jgi:hypothetical protein
MFAAKFSTIRIIDEGWRREREKPGTSKGMIDATAGLMNCFCPHPLAVSSRVSKPCGLRAAKAIAAGAGASNWRVLYSAAFAKRETPQKMPALPASTRHDHAEPLEVHRVIG